MLIILILTFAALKKKRKPKLWLISRLSFKIIMNFFKLRTGIPQLANPTRILRFSSDSYTNGPPACKLNKFEKLQHQKYSRITHLNLPYKRRHFLHFLCKSLKIEQNCQLDFHRIVVCNCSCSACEDW